MLKGLWSVRGRRGGFQLGVDGWPWGRALRMDGWSLTAVYFPGARVQGLASH